MAKKQEFSIETVKKYYFWVIVPLGLGAAFFVTTGAVAKITAEFNSRKQTLESTKKTVEGIRGDREHPNQRTVDEINTKTAELIDRVVSAWRVLEKDQKERNLWPADALGRDFMVEVGKLKFGGEFSVNAREIYLNFVDKYIPYLEQYVDRRRLQMKNKANGEWEELDPMAPGGGGALSGIQLSGGFSDGILADDLALPKDENGEDLYRYVGVVDWPNPETRYVTSHWQKVPKAVEIWYAQEDLWVYGALLSVIKETNSGATGPHNAVIKRIANLSIGKNASSSLADRSALRINSGGGGSELSGGDMMGMSSTSDMTMSSVGASFVAQTEAEAREFILDQRYVDQNAQPLSASASPPFNEFNRMPICLRLIVDQRRIPEILVNCANCAMPIEVLWVRINPGATRPFEIAAYAGGGAVGGEVTSETGTIAASSSGAANVADNVPLQLGGSLGAYGTESIPIEIYGWINIFNSADDAKGLQPKEAQTETQTENTTE